MIYPIITYATNPICIIIKSRINFLQYSLHFDPEKKTKKALRNKRYEKIIILKIVNGFCVF